jgi:predicted Zn-dependent peptidase
LITAIALAAVLGSGADDFEWNEVPRLRTQFPNRSQCLVECIPGARSASVQLWIRAGATQDRYETHGYRHVLEHFQAQGFDGNLDATLEAQGIFLTAGTYRRAMVFELKCAPEQVPIAVAACASILRPRPLTAEMIAQEALTIREEQARRTPESRLSELAWSTAYGEAGLDPFGKVETIAAATPAKLGELWSRMTTPEHLAIVVAGDVKIDPTTAQVAKVLANRKGPASVVPPAPLREMSAPTLETASGGMYAKVGSCRDVQTAAAIIAAYGLMSHIPAPFFIYQPTVGPGLVLFGSARPSLNWARVRRDAASVESFEIGRLFARFWIARQLRDPSLVAGFRGELLVQSPSLSPEQLRTNISQVTYAQYQRALLQFVPVGIN